jgi:FlaG/FlaF family flagellin (archaellin)
MKMGSKHSSQAVSEVLGTVLLIAIAVALFSVIYTTILFAPTVELNQKPVIVGEIRQNRIILEHQGGESILFTDSTIVIDAAEQTYISRTNDDINDNGRWDIGERIIFEYGSLDHYGVEVKIVDTKHNILLLSGILQQGKTVTLQTQVLQFPSYVVNLTQLTINATNLTEVDSISLWYQYSFDNASWDNWTLYQSDSNGTDGWNWEFSFFQSCGYYQFYSIGQKSDTIEQPPSYPDTSCFYAPLFSINTTIDPITPYEQTQQPLHLTILGDRCSLDNVTLWYRWSKDNITWSVGDPVGTMPVSVTSSYEWDAQEGRQPSVCRVNMSEFYLVASCGDSGSDYDGWVKTIRVFNNNGTIQQVVMSSYEYDTSDGNYSCIVHLPGTDKYAISYRDTTGDRVTVVTLQVSDVTGTIVQSVIDSKRLTYDGLYTNMILVSANDSERDGWIIAIAYQEGGTNGVSATNDGFLETIWINRTGTINDTVLSIREFDTADCLYPNLCTVDNDTIAICYTTSSSDGYISSWNISSSGVIANTRADGWEYDTSNGQYPSFIHIDENIFAVAYRDSDSRGYVKTFTIFDNGTISKSFIDTLTFTGTMVNLYNYIFQVLSSRVYGISFQGLSADGYICTMNISANGTIGDSVIDTIEFDTNDNAYIAPVVHVNESNYLIIYQGTSEDGWSRTVEILTSIDVNGIDWNAWENSSNPDFTYPWEFNFSFPNGIGYYELYSIGKSDGMNDENATGIADVLCSYAEEEQITGRQAQWHINEGAGIVVYDDIGQYNGTIHGATWTTGIDGSALNYNGTSDYVDMTNSSNFPLNNTISFEAWVYTQEQKTAKIIQKGDWDGHGLGLDVWNGWNGGIYINGNKSSLYWGSGQPELNKWYHLVLTYDGLTLRLYVNGTEMDNHSVSGNLRVNSRNMFIGSDAGAQKFFHGSIDEVTIYDRPLTPLEVESRYNMYRQ